MENSSIIGAEQAAELLRKGAVVALPTETVYGLAARIGSDDALAEIFRLKGRPADNPLIVHVDSIDQASELGKVTRIDRLLAQAFWPGPLTLVLGKNDSVPQLITAGLATVAVRMPDHPVFLEVLGMLDEPLAAPSANISGRPSPTSAAHVLADFDGRVPVVDGGVCRTGLESTVVRVEYDRVLLLRPGSITRKQITAVAGLAVVTANAADLRSSPGTRYRHYAPTARLRLCYSAEDVIQRASNEDPKQMILSVEDPHLGIRWVPLQADSLYAELRRADELQVDEILVHCDDETIRDEALMNRLLRAADTDSEAG